MTTWLLTWLWQGVALALGVSMAFRVLPRMNAATRYLIWWGTFAALIWLGWTSSPHAGSPMVPVAPAPALSPGFLFHVPPLPPWAVAVLVGVWWTVALFKLLRILPAVQGLYRLKDACRPIPSSIEAQLPLWQDAKTRGRPVQLMLSDDLRSPAVLGLHQPSIAVPAALLDVVNPEELDQIVLHEYGHVQRRDDWTRLAQALLESALWVHPATIWIGRGLNLEREVACDDWVVSKTGAPRAYAGCLSRVADHTCGHVAPGFAPGMFGRRRDLLRRVDRLLDARHNARRACSPAGVFVGVCLITATAGYLRSVPLVSEVVTTAADPTVMVRGLRRAPPVAPADMKAGTIGTSDTNQEPVQEASGRRETVRTLAADRPVRFEPDSTTATGATTIAGDTGSVAGADEPASIDELASINEGISLVQGRVVDGIYRGGEPAQMARLKPGTTIGDEMARLKPGTTIGAEIARLKPATTIGAEIARLKPATTIVGVSIGNATRTASLGLASAFSRASASLAKSFWRP